VPGGWPYGAICRNSTERAALYRHRSLDRQAPIEHVTNAQPDQRSRVLHLAGHESRVRSLIARWSRHATRL